MTSILHKFTNSGGVFARCPCLTYYEKTSQRSGQCLKGTPALLSSCEHQLPLGRANLIPECLLLCLPLVSGAVFTPGIPLLTHWDRAHPILPIFSCFLLTLELTQHPALRPVTGSTQTPGLQASAPAVPPQVHDLRPPTHVGKKDRVQPTRAYAWGPQSSKGVRRSGHGGLARSALP